MAIVCNMTTWVPYFHVIAGRCLQLRLMYFQHGIQGAANQGLGGRNCATIYYRRVAGGNLCHVTNSSESGVGAARHSERVCWAEMVAREGGVPAIIECVYSERYPCGPQNQNCYAFLDANLPHGTHVFWSFEWPDVADTFGPKPKKRKKDGDGDYDDQMKKYKAAAEKARTAREAGTRDLKHYQRDIDYAGSVKTKADITIDGLVDDPQTITLLGEIGKGKPLPNPAPRSGLIG